MVWIGHGAPAICRPDDGAVFSAGVAFAAAAGEGEARPVLVPGGGDPFNHQLVLRLVAQLRARDLLLHSGKLQEMRHQVEQDSAVLRARARRYSRCPGPYAFYQETLVARKYNRGARCGGYPSPAQYPLPRTRRVLAGCGNKYSRSRHKHARPAGTFLIAAADKYRFLPRRTAD